MKNVMEFYILPKKSSKSYHQGEITIYCRYWHHDRYFLNNSHDNIYMFNVLSTIFSNLVIVESNIALSTIARCISARMLRMSADGMCQLCQSSNVVVINEAFEIILKPSVQKSPGVRLGDRSGHEVGKG